MDPVARRESRRGTAPRRRLRRLNHAHTSSRPVIRTPGTLATTLAPATPPRTSRSAASSKRGTSDLGSAAGSSNAATPGETAPTSPAWTRIAESTVDSTRREGTTSARTAFCAKREASSAGRERQASACQPGSQQVTRPGEPALDRPDRPFEEGGHLLVGLPLQVAEDDGLPIFLGESADLLVQHGPELVPGDVVVVTRGQHRRALPFPSVTPGRVGLRSNRRAVGHLVEPVAQHLAIADRPGLADEQEERGLEGVLGVLRLVEHVPADAQDHRPMPPDERLEGGLRLRGPTVQEPRQQLAIASPPRHPPSGGSRGRWRRSSPSVGSSCPSP